MNRLTYEDLVTNPELVDAIHAQARRERARAFDRLVFSPLKAFFAHLLNGSGNGAHAAIRRA
jgi:hypothetical protein